MASTTAHNVLAGAFLLGTVGLGVGVAFTLSNGVSTATTPFTVRFTLADGATGLKRGSEVLLGGQKVGRVERVDVAPDPGTGAAAWIDVVVRVRNDVTLYEDAAVFLDRPLLGSLSTINIAGVGTPGLAPFHGGGPQLEPSERVAGALAPPSFMAQAGFGVEQAAALRGIVSDAERLVERITAMVDRDGPLIDETLTDAREVMRTVRAEAPAWTESLNRAREDIERAADRLGPMLDEADGAVREARAAAAGVRAAVEENRASVDRMVANAERATERVSGPTLDLADETLIAGRDAAREAGSIAQSTGDFVRDELPPMRRVLANLRLMSDQLRLTSVEVRAQPWRLLFRPDTKELEAQLLYDSARAYADAVAELRAAGETLEAATDPAAGRPAESEEVRALVARVKEAFAKYEEAQRSFLDRLVEGSR